MSCPILWLTHQQGNPAILYKTNKKVVIALGWQNFLGVFDSPRTCWKSCANRAPGCCPCGFVLQRSLPSLHIQARHLYLGLEFCSEDSQVRDLSFYHLAGCREAGPYLLPLDTWGFLSQLSLFGDGTVSHLHDLKMAVLYFCLSNLRIWIHSFSTPSPVMTFY